MDIEKLIKEKDYFQIKQELNNMNEHDIALILEDIDNKEVIKLFRLLNKDIAADVFSCIDTDTQKIIISSLTDVEAANIINDMYADDATDLIDEMPANVVKKITF